MKKIILISAFALSSQLIMGQHLSDRNYSREGLSQETINRREAWLNSEEYQRSQQTVNAVPAGISAQQKTGHSQTALMDVSNTPAVQVSSSSNKSIPQNAGGYIPDDQRMKQPSSSPMNIDLQKTGTRSNISPMLPPSLQNKR